jgi:hypothetical protein
VSATVICVNSGNKVFLFPSLSYYLLISTFFFLFFVIYTHARLDLIFLYFFKENETQQNQIYNQLFILFFLKVISNFCLSLERKKKRHSGYILGKLNYPESFVLLLPPPILFKLSDLL